MSPSLTAATAKTYPLCFPDSYVNPLNVISLSLDNVHFSRSAAFTVPILL